MKNIDRAFIMLVAAALPAAACDLGVLTDDERSQLEEMAIAPLPPSPSNAFADNVDAARLGHKFFHDKRFSGPLVESSLDLGPVGTVHTIACATCHDPKLGGADPRPLGGTSLGAAWTGRHTPTVINAAYSPWLMWDGRRDSLWSQALGPIEGWNEQNTTRVNLVRTIYDLYRQPYEALFGAMPPMDDFSRFPPDGKPGMPAWDNMAAADKIAVNRVFANFGKAIEAYERRLVDTTSPFDRYLKGDENAMTAAQIRGAKVFVGKAACNECHSGSMLADGKFHNHGVPQAGAKVAARDGGRHDGIPQLLADEFNSAGPYSDMGRPDRWSGLQAHEGDLGAFKTPTLRNVSKTAPYMHTGNFASLWDVVNWYNLAAGTDGFVGKREAASLVPLKLTNEEMSDLVEFMKALEGNGPDAEWTNLPALP
jgi:cytochrome c peroxidase